MRFSIEFNPYALAAVIIAALVAVAFLDRSDLVAQMDGRPQHADCKIIGTYDGPAIKEVDNCIIHLVP
jgi:hypothetical protein